MPYVQPYIQAQLGSTVFCTMETYRVVWTLVVLWVGSTYGNHHEACTHCESSKHYFKTIQ